MSHRPWALRLLIAALALSLHVPAASAEPSVVVESIDGQADVQTVGDVVTAITTGADARVVAHVDAMNDVTVYQNTQLEFGALVGLRVGTVRARGALTIATANAQSTVADSEITVAYDDQSGTTTIEVFDHEATVQGRNDAAAQHVAAGQTVRVGPAGISSAPRAISDDGISAARVAPSATVTDGADRARYAVASLAVVCLLGTLVAAQRARRKLATA